MDETDVLEVARSRISLHSFLWRFSMRTKQSNFDAQERKGILYNDEKVEESKPTKLKHKRQFTQQKPLSNNEPTKQNQNNQTKHNQTSRTTINQTNTYE